MLEANAEAEAERSRKKADDLKTILKHIKRDFADTQHELEFIKESTIDTAKWITNGVGPLTSYS